MICVVPARAGIRRRWFPALFALSLAACGGRGLYWPVIPPELPPPRVVSDSADGTTVDVVRTQIVQVHLPMEASSANRWSYELGKDRALYPAGDTPRLEGPADQVFTFRAEGSGTTSVRFTYRDPAQPQSAPAKSVAFDVVAR